ncbi:hypothetical protein DM02DRAFT_332306 [Periconia macrospinosa]|uniref:Uncharacterized protein n=1 Tax=Periconia macrospinosa TaxID=97972 RepID=A0A2V1DYI0_9PLEO|nr:hypothetical protein DM02DRAFT_332306 [Periconia macrospinosa]
MLLSSPSLPYRTLPACRARQPAADLPQANAKVDASWPNILTHPDPSLLGTLPSLLCPCVPSAPDHPVRYPPASTFHHPTSRIPSHSPLSTLLQQPRISSHSSLKT